MSSPHRVRQDISPSTMLKQARRIIGVQTVHSSFITSAGVTESRAMILSSMSTLTSILDDRLLKLHLPNYKVGRWDDWAPKLGQSVGMNSEGVQELLDTKDSPITWEITGPGAKTWQVILLYCTVTCSPHVDLHSCSVTQSCSTLWDPAGL